MTTLTVKASNAFAAVGKDLASQSQGASLFTVKHKQGDVTATLEFNDKTLNDPASLTGVNAKVAYRVNSDLSVDASFDLAAKKYNVGGEYKGEVADRKVTLEARFAEKDKTVSGEASVAIDSNNKATLTFSNLEVTSAKYSFSNNGITYEPSYCLKRQAPSLTVSKKEGKATYKATYNVKDEKATVEWSQNPWKVSASASAGQKGLGKPSVTATWEKTYDF